jgi:anti-sigma B factor antagonist
MPIERWSDEVSVVHVGDDPQFTDDLSSVLSNADAPGHAVVLDLSALHFINSSNLAFMLRLRQKLVTGDGRLILCGVPNEVWGAFLVTGLDKVFDFSDNVSTALATLQMS